MNNKRIYLLDSTGRVLGSWLEFSLEQRISVTGGRGFMREDDWNMRSRLPGPPLTHSWTSEARVCHDGLRHSLDFMQENVFEPVVPLGRAIICSYAAAFLKSLFSNLGLAIDYLTHSLLSCMKHIA
jgi:hypothetical protein